MAIEPRDTWRARLRSRACLRGKIALNGSARRMIARSLFDPDRRVIMDFNAKAGCTVAVRMFLDHMGLLDEALEYRKWIHHYRRDVFSARHPTTIEAFLSRRNVLFKVVRNPFPRVISALRNKVRTGKGIEKIVNSLKLERIEDITFRQFVRYLESIDLRERCDSHYRHQSRKYEKLDLRRPFVCKVETLEADVARLNERFGFAFNPANVTSSHHAKIDSDVDAFVADVPWREFGEALPGYRHFYDAGLAEQVAKLYRPDLEAYQYQFPWPEFGPTQQG